MSLSKNKSAGLKISEDYIELIVMLHLFPKWNAIAMDQGGAEIGCANSNELDRLLTLIGLWSQ
jgi:hypothetical protein